MYEYLMYIVIFELIMYHNVYANELCICKIIVH